MLGAGPDVADPGGHPGLTSGPLPGILGSVVLITLTVVAGRLLGVRLRWARVLIAGILVVWTLAGRQGLAPYLSGRSRPSLALQTTPADHESLRSIGSRE